MKFRYFILCFIFLFSSCSLKKYDVAYIGENKLVSYFPNNKNIDLLYSFEDLSIHNLYKIVDNNSKIKNEKVSIKDIIKKSKNVFINIGYCNVKNVLSNINMDILTSEIDLFHYYLYEMIESIKEVNRNIYVSSILMEQIEYKTIYILFNQEIEEVCKKTSVTYIDINVNSNIEGNLNDIFG